MPTKICAFWLYTLLTSELNGAFLYSDAILDCNNIGMEHDIRAHYIMVHVYRHGTDLSICFQ